MENKLKCLEIYRDAFHDNDTSFEEHLFEHCFSDCRFLKVDGEIISMLFALPCRLIYESQEKSATYIYAAATAKKHQKKGYMSKLIKSLTQDNNSFIFLRPANNSLIGFYERLGFKCINTQNFKANTPKIIPTESFSRLIVEYADIGDKTDYKIMYYQNGGFAPEGLNFIYSME